MGGYLEQDRINCGMGGQLSSTTRYGFSLGRESLSLAERHKPVLLP
jgi:hypothetical protein